MYTFIFKNKNEAFEVLKATYGSILLQNKHLFIIKNEDAFAVNTVIKLLNLTSEIKAPNKSNYSSYEDYLDACADWSEFQREYWTIFLEE